MCGITGWVAFDRDLRGMRHSIEAMTETMACRGPDGAGAFLDQHVALGHRRLVVIDPEGGAQPMAVETPHGSINLVYSGETFNFPELRTELRGRGHQFRTESDTEVVLLGYLEWGAAVAERLNGMYALAIWDARVSRLVLIRDRMGVKPLYYYPTPGGVLFGSEPKAILANPVADKVVNLDSLRELFGFVKSPGHAIWAGMREVEPGTLVTADAGGLRVTRYWSLETRPHSDDRATTVRNVRDLLDDIISHQLVADVPTCTLLSGGLDSSSLTAIAARQQAARGEKVRSFSVDFAGLAENFVPDALRPTPDTPYIKDVAEYAGTMHHDIVLSAQAMTDPAIRRNVIQARDFPSGLGDLDLSLYLLMREISQHATVALTGESADELFGGYRQFFDPEARKGKTFPWLANHHQFFGRQADAPVQHGILHAALERALDMDDYIQDSYDAAVAQIQMLPGESDFEWQMRKISYLHLTRFVRIWLDRKDRLSMASGLEVRVPFCDHRLVEYVFNAPWALKTYDGKEKSLLRGAAADVLPDSVVRRRKVPYPSTQDPTYATALRQQCQDLLARANHPVFDVVDRNLLKSAVATDYAMIDQASRTDLERALDLSVWLELHSPKLALS